MTLRTAFGWRDHPLPVSAADQLADGRHAARLDLSAGAGAGADYWIAVLVTVTVTVVVEVTVVGTALVTVVVTVVGTVVVTVEGGGAGAVEVTVTVDGGGAGAVVVNGTVEDDGAGPGGRLDEDVGVGGATGAGDTSRRPAGVGFVGWRADVVSSVAVTGTLRWCGQAMISPRQVITVAMTSAPNLTRRRVRPV